MKRTIFTLFVVLALTLMAAGQITNPPGYVTPVNVGAATAIGPGGVMTSSSLVLTVAPGPVYCRGALNFLGGPSTFALSANTTYFVYFDCAQDQVVVTTVPPTNFYPLIGTAVAGASTIALTDNRSALQFPPAGNSGSTAYVTGSAYTNATTTFSNVTGLAFPIAASQNYRIKCSITWQGSAGTTGPKYQFTGPASPTAVSVTAHSIVTATTVTTATAVAFSSPVANAGTITTATNFTDDVEAAVLNGVNAGTVQLQAAANGAGTLTIQLGSNCSVLP